MKNSDDAEFALHLLASFVGPAGSYPFALTIPWEQFLNQTKTNTRSTVLKNLIGAYQVQLKMYNRDFGGAISLADNLLDNKPDDDLWLYCQSEKIGAYCNVGEINGARSLLQAIQSRAVQIDPLLTTELEALISSFDSNGSNSLVKASRSNGKNSVKGDPSLYALGQNYPNPFNPSTIIRYDIPEESYVTLKVYNVLGQVVATLIDGVQDAGSKTAVLDGKDLPSGLYFYRLQAGTFSDVKKLLLMK